MHYQLINIKESLILKVFMAQIFKPRTNFFGAFKASFYKNFQQHLFS